MMNHPMPEGMLELRGFLPDLVAEAKKHVRHARVLFTQSGGLVVIKTRGEDRVNPLPPRPGIRITVWNGATFHTVATNRLHDKDHLIALARELAESVPQLEGPAPDEEPEMDAHFVSRYEIDADAVDSRIKQAICDRVFREICEHDSRIANAQVIYRSEHEYRMFCDGSRLLSSDVRNVGLKMIAFASNGSRQVIGTGDRAGTGHEVTEFDETLARGVAEQALEHLRAEKIEPGSYRVILDPGLAGTLAHESVGHGCELDCMIRGGARSLAHIGERVGSDLVTIKDYGGLPGHYGSIFFSDDGVLADKPAVLVQDGILQPTVMTDLYSYLMYRDRMPGLILSANGRLESYDHPIYSRMTNTYFEPLPVERGGQTLDELIRGTDSGVLLEHSPSGMEDPLGWGIQIQALRGSEIKDGSLTGRLHYQIGLSGYVPEVLGSVDGVTSDRSTESGYCGKGHKEWVRTSAGGPYVRCKLKLG